MAYHYIRPKEYNGTVQFRYWVHLAIAQLVERRTVNPQVMGSNPIREIKLSFKNKRNYMDSATMTYLVNSRKFVDPKPKNEYDPKYKKQILELTEKLFEENINNDIYVSFESYISDCMRYFKKMEQDEVIAKEREKEIIPIHGDEYIFVPKKISVIAKPKQKNIFLIHDKNRA